MSLSFNTLREANMKRIPQFRNAKGELAHSEPDGSDWSPAEWLQATVGELGELANMLKKVNRGDYSFEEGREAIAKEFADVAIYLDLFAYQFRIDLGEAVRKKFNEVSNRVNVPVYISQADAVCSHDPDPKFDEYRGTATFISDGRGSKVESLPTGEDLDEQAKADIDYFRDRLAQANRQAKKAVAPKRDTVTDIMDALEEDIKSMAKYINEVMTNLGKGK